MNKIEFGDCRDIMRRWADEGVKVQTCVTSPPYFGLRDYGTGRWVGGNESCDHIKTINKHGGQRADRDQSGQVFKFKDVCEKCGAVREDNQLGLEETPEQYIAAMVEVFRCVKNVLADDGTLWLNIGDSYAAQRGGTHQPAETLAGGKGGKMADGSIVNRDRHAGYNPTRNAAAIGLKHKDLIGIPWMLAFALRADGWYLRQDIIWHKPNPMPESVTDRCTKAHEYIFLMSKSEKYFFDNEAIKEQAVGVSGGSPLKARDEKYRPDKSKNNNSGLANGWEPSENRNRRSVWTVNTKPYEGAHFAVYPTELIEPCIMAGSKIGDIVLDPFMGSGTTAQVAKDLGRKYLGCELNPAFKELQDKRLRQLSLELA